MSEILDKIANWMRRKADRISPSTAPRSMGAYATFDSMDNDSPADIKAVFADWGLDVTITKETP